MNALLVHFVEIVAFPRSTPCQQVYPYLHSKDLTRRVPLFLSSAGQHFQNQLYLADRNYLNPLAAKKEFAGTLRVGILADA